MSNYLLTGKREKIQPNSNKIPKIFQFNAIYQIMRMTKSIIKMFLEKLMWSLKSVLKNVSQGAIYVGLKIIVFLSANKPMVILLKGLLQ